MTKGCERVSKDFIENSGDSAYSDMTLKIMELECLDRIAAALKNINCTLETISGSVELLEKLSDCVDDTRGYGERLCVTGTITNYEG